jgi:deoxycytidylate deaminase
MRRSQTVPEDVHIQHFLEAAYTARQATCKRALCGSIVVSESGRILGRGYNAPPLGQEDQRMCDVTFSQNRKPKSDKTCCIHAEWNAILNALAHDAGEVAGATLYFARIDQNSLEITQAGEPYCTVCSRLALQSGIAQFGLWNDGPQMIKTDLYNKVSYDFYV